MAMVLLYSKPFLLFTECVENSGDFWPLVIPYKCSIYPPSVWLFECSVLTDMFFTHSQSHSH